MHGHISLKKRRRFGGEGCKRVFEVRLHSHTHGRSFDYSLFITTEALESKYGAPDRPSITYFRPSSCCMWIENAIAFTLVF